MSWYGWLVAAIAAITTTVLSTLRSLVQQELEQSCRPFADWILRRAARLLPPTHQDRYLAEWLAELDSLGDRKLRAIGKAATIRAWAFPLRRALLGTSSAYPRMLAWYSVSVSSAGLLVGSWWAVTDGVQAARTIDGWVILLCGLSVLHNCRTIPILDRIGKIDQGAGSLFEYVLILGWPVGISIPTIMVAGLISHMIRHWHDRPALGKALFNMGQFALAGSVAAWAIHDLGFAPAAGRAQLTAVAGGMILYSMTNTMIMRIAVALDRTSANLRAFWSGWPLDVAEWTLMALLASACALAAHPLLCIGLLLVLAIGYGKVMARLNELVRPHIHLPQ